MQEQSRGSSEGSIIKKKRAIAKAEATKVAQEKAKQKEKAVAAARGRGETRPQGGKQQAQVAGAGAKGIARSKKEDIGGHGAKRRQGQRKKNTKRQFTLARLRGLT